MDVKEKEADYMQGTTNNAKCAEKDFVNHPEHYNSGKFEVIDIIKDQLSPEEFRGYIKGNVLKYIMRERLKGGNEDLKKADKYLQMFFERVEEA
jgi:hypothetical protein